MNFPSLRRQARSSLLILTSLAALIAPCWGDEAAPRRDVPRPGGCPDFIELIKDIAPVVVNISIERHQVRNSSASPPPLFRLNPRYFDDRARLGDGSALSDGLGSGFVADSAGYIVTNAHLVDGASKILVTLSSGKVLNAKVMAVHPKVDLALLKVTPPYPLQKARIGDPAKLQIGEWVLAVGNPYGLSSSFTAGIVSGKDRFLGRGPDDSFIQTDASINPGNSGGPLFNTAGEVIGVNTAIIAPAKGIGFAIPSDYVAELMRSPANQEDGIVRGWLGIYVQDVTEQQARQLGMNQPRGTFVDEVLGSAPAYSAGLKKGDLIIDADGKPIRDGRHLSRIVAESKPGDVIKMKIQRGKKTQTVDVTIGKSPE